MSAGSAQSILMQKPPTINIDLSRVINFYKEHIERCERALHAFLDTHQISGGEAYFRALRDNLPDRFFKLTHKVLLSHYQILGPGTSFDDYCASLDNPEVRAFFYERYPVLQGWMDSLAQDWIDQSCLLLLRLEADRELIQRDIFCSSEPLDIARIDFGMGDRHRAGRSVARLEFACGRKLVYKPRSLQIDLHFSALVAWICAGNDMSLTTPVTLQRGDYGWVKFIEPRECVNQAEVDLYYERLGNWLALLYLLEGQDFHFENLIADGPHPMLIDLESFFHPRPPAQGNEVVDYADNSILRTGILPSGAVNDLTMPDVSGIADVEGAEGFVERLDLLADADGGLRFQRSRGTLKGSNNVPRLHGVNVVLNSAMVAQLQRGFRVMYMALLERKDALRDQLATFKHDEVRVLFRHTVTYAHLLDESTHPLLMRDPARLDKHFRLLERVIPQFPAAARFVEHEIADLKRRDVPLLTNRVGSLDLWYADDGCVPDFFQHSGYDSVIAKLDALSVEDMQQQHWLIAKSLVTLDALAAGKSRNGPPLPHADYSSATGVRQRLLDEAVRVGDYIIAQVDVEEGQANWLVMRSVALDNSKMDVAPAFYDLYAGMPGEILFLSQLSRLTGEPKYGVLADQACKTLLSRLDRSSHLIYALGLYIGWGSVIFFLTSLGTARRDQTYFDKIEHYFDSMDFDALIAADTNYSLIKGSCGFMLACAEYHMASGSPRALALAHACAAHLLGRRQAGSPGFSWRIASAVPLSGMAHGASGFAMAFARMYEATAQPRYAEASLAALAYERTLYVPAQQNWEDCREYVRKHANGATVCANTWAHGAPGIGIARLEIARSGVHDAAMDAELAVASGTTVASTPSRSHSLLSGAFGNIELLLSGGEYGQGDVAAAITPIAARLLGVIDTEGWCLGGQKFSPLGFLTGVTGVGYQCLRAAFPGELPSILGARCSAFSPASMAQQSAA